MEPGQTIGKYEIRQRLAQGGMAEVYVAVLRGAAGFEKPVALKRILPGLQDIGGFEQMFAQEARLVARLAHDNIVQVHDFDRVGDLGFYIAMELVDGCDLAALARAAATAGRRLAVPLVVRIVHDVGAALLHAHTCTDGEGRSLGLVHRDVSPQNVLISRDGAVKLTDFGIAKAYAAAAGEATRTGLVKGKVAYMSPEQTRGESLDGRSDLFALGIVLWELLAGARLFRADDDLGALEAVRRRPVPPPSAHNPKVPAALDRIVARCLERDLARRYPAAGPLLRDLEALPDVDLGQGGREAVARAVREYREGRAGVDFAPEPVVRGAPEAETRGPGSPAPGPEAEPPGPAAETPELVVQASRSRTRARWVYPVALAVAAAAVIALWSTADIPARDGREAAAPPRKTTPAAPASTTPAAPGTTAPVAPGTTAPAAPEEPVADRPLGTASARRNLGASVPARPGDAPDLPGTDAKPEAELCPRRSATTAPPPSATPATVTFNVIPWGYVAVDGESLGQAPVTDLELAPGPHAVRIEHPQLGRREYTLDLEPGDNGTIVLRFAEPSPATP